MNTRKFGKILIGIGIVILLAYVGWIVFRVVAQPELVQERGLLPNPFTESLPIQLPFGGDNTEDVGPDSTIINAPTIVPTESEKKLFPVVRDYVVGYGVFGEEKKLISNDPETGKPIEQTISTPRIRYARASDGNIFDIFLESGVLTPKTISLNYIDGLSSIDFGVQSYTGSYQSGSNYKRVYFVNTPTVESVKNTPTLECPVDISVPIKKGDQNATIEYIQNLITRRTGYNQFSVGAYDDAFTAGVTQYQKQYGMKSITGTLDKSTIELLQRDCQQYVSFQSNGSLSSQSQTFKTSLLPGNIIDSLFDTENNALIVMKTLGTGTSVISRSLDTGTEKTLYSLPFSEWNLYPTKGGLYFTTRAAQTYAGSVFFVPFGGNGFSPVLVGYTGVAIMPSHSGDTVLYSTTENGIPSIGIFNRQTKEVTLVTGVNTFAEKCVWNNDDTQVYCAVPTTILEGVYPDEWYKRGTEFADALYRIDPNTGESVSLDQTGEIAAEKIDSIRLEVSSDGQYLFFQDWNTGYVWGYRL